MGEIMERLQGISSASINYPYKLRKPVGEGKIVCVAESMGNEDREREGGTFCSKMSPKLTSPYFRRC